MQRFRSLVMLFFAMVASSCGNRAVCNCPTGCCSPTGTCEAGAAATACGERGASCAVCGAGQVCAQGRCVAPATAGGNTGPGTAGGSAGGASEPPVGGGQGTAGGAAAGGPSGGGMASGGGAGPSSPTWYKDVLPVTQVKCGACHKQGGIGPFSLETYAQARTVAAAIKASVVAKTMPPWMPDTACGGPFVNDQSLSQTQIDTIARWVDQGAVEGNPADAPPAPGPVGELPRVDATLTMRDAYTPSSTVPDDYRCFLVDPALTANRSVIGYDIRPQVTAEVHHVIVYIVDRNAAQTKDLNEAGPGWTCYGDSGVANSPGPIGAWAPGTGAVIYPSGTGIALTPSQALAMQIHYNTSNGTRTPDQTAIRLMYAPAGSTVTAARLLPLVASGFMIPPNAVGYSFSRDFPNPTRAVPIKIWGLLPHMHTLGKRITIATTANECLVDIPRWDFHWQAQYFRPQPFILPGTGGLKMTCTWDNPSTRTIGWGEGTSDEMCFAYIYATL